MTRARDELVLTHAADYGGRRARRVSPFVLEALDLPPAAVDPASGADEPARSSGSPRSRRPRVAAEPARADRRRSRSR